ncbi:MAG: DUF1573 domain-containing protein [Planctomycetaceae bacterium]
MTNPNRISSAVTHPLIIAAAMLVLGAVPAQAQEWAEKMFSQKTIDFGHIARGANAVYLLKVKNLYKEDVHISNVRTTCGCSAATPSKNRLGSLEESIISVTMDTLRFSQRKDSNVIVTIDQPYFAEIRIPVTAYIRPDVVLKPGAADFGAVEQGQPSKRTLSVAYAGRSDWKIKSVESTNEYITGRVVETSRGAGRVAYSLEVLISKQAPAGRLRTQVTLVTDDSGNPRVPILVDATVEADLTVIPPIISLGVLKPGEQKRKSVVLRGRKPFAIEKIEAESNSGAFRIKLTKTSKKIHVLPLTFTAPEKLGPVNETFTVTIPGRPEPLTFRASGKIVEP